MPGSITDTGELYSPYVGLVYMFNLIVGTGALTMPKAFATAGWLVSLILIMFLGFMRSSEHHNLLPLPDEVWRRTKRNVVATALLFNIFLILVCVFNVF